MFFFLTMTERRPLLDGDVIREALRCADLSLTKAALWMEMDPRLLDRQLQGEGHLKHSALMKLPVSFHRWYHFLMAGRVGLPKEVKRALPLTLSLMGRKRMARMETQQQNDERKLA